MAKQALDGKRLNAFAMDPDDLFIVGLDAREDGTVDGPEHPLWDQRVHMPLDLALKDNVKVNGVLEWVIVRKDGDTVEVVAGKQRVRCAREANKELVAEGKVPIRVPVTVRRGNDGQAFGVLISENQLRRDDSPMAKAENLGRYLAMGYSEDEAAVTFGVNKQTIRTWNKLLDLDAKVHKAVDSGKIAATAAAKLADLPRAEQIQELDKLLANGKATVAAASHAARSRQTGTEAPKAPKKRLVRKVLEANSAYEGEAPLSPDFVRGVRWVLGDLPDTSIKGLRALIAESTQ